MKYFLILAATLFFQAATAQLYDGNPCVKANPELKLLLGSKTVNSLYISACNPDRGVVATSFLKSSGKKPVSEKDPGFVRPDDWEGDVEYDKWTCMYAGARAFDEDNTTAWVEGIPGNGKGELLLFTELDLNRKIEIWSGYGKSQATFSTNNRPRSLKVHVIRSTSKPENASQCGNVYESLKIVASGAQTLKDVNSFQPLGIPVFKKEKYTRSGEQEDYSYFLMIELVDVYAGSKFQDTCITGVRNVQ